MKRFNVTGTCIPDRHYMADISGKVAQIAKLIEQEEYFTINRARQYGKTTTFAAIDRALRDQYHIIRLSFEIISEDSFADNAAFVETFISMAADKMAFTSLDQALIDRWRSLDDWRNTDRRAPFACLGRKITELCRNSDKEILLMIDEVDKSSDNQVFLNFLGMLRSKYLERQEGRDLTFKSVILAGVYDIKNRKLKIRPDAEKKYNSPWNIAADFTVDMSFSPAEIAAMLQDYENDRRTGMDIQKISEELYFYTSGYPFLVSRLCKWVEEEGGRIWTTENLREAEKAVLKLRNTLFDDLIKNVENHRELRELIMSILYDGTRYAFQLSNPVIELGAMFGILCERDHMTAISNVIFETYLYDYTVSVKSMEEKRLAETDQNQFVRNGRLDMPRVLEKFQEVMWSEYRREDGAFVKRQGRLLFLCFLKPVINGRGFYYVEPETRNNTRMDIVVAFGGEEHIIELKIWHGAKYRAEGICQLEQYLDSRNADTGYLISFSFTRRQGDGDHACGWIPHEESRKNIFEITI